MQKSLTEMIEEKGNVIPCHMRKATWLRGKKKRKSPSEPFNERSGRNLRVRRKVCIVEGTYIPYGAGGE